MSALHPEEWDGLFATVHSWLFDGDVRTVIDTTGNTGNLLTTLQSRYIQPECTWIKLAVDSTADTPPIRFFPDDCYSEGGSETVTVSESLQNADKGSNETVPPNLADVVCGFELANRKEYTEKSVPDELKRLLGREGRPEHERILSSIATLRDGGRGMLVVPRSMIMSYNTILEYFDHTRIHAIIDLNSNRFGFEEIDRRFQFSVLLFEKQDLRDGEQLVRQLRVDEFDERLGFFIQAPVSHLSGVDLNEKSLKFRGVPQQDLLDYPPQVPFNIPELLPIFRSDEFVKLGELDDVAIHRGLQQPLPDAYYFTKSEIDKSSISSDLFSPIITYETLANSGRVVTEAEMEQYVLDLTEQVKEVKRSIDDSSMEEILDGLSNQGYSDAVNYLSTNIEQRSSRTGYWFCPFLSQTEREFALAFPRLAPDAKWTRVDCDSAILSYKCLGISCNDEITARGISRAVQTKGYRRLIEDLFDSSFGGVIHYKHYLIDQIPIPRRGLTQDFDDRSDSLFPLETHRSEVRLTELLAGCVQNELARETFENLLAPDDEYAWAWFLSPEEYDEFIQKWETDPEAAKQYVVDHLGDEDIEQIRSGLSDESIPPERSQILEELLEEYLNQKNRMFLYGVAPQFEGVLMDWAEYQGHELGTDDNGNFVVYVDADDQQRVVSKTLSSLLRYYLQDGFGEFLHEYIRERRNELAHGSIVENDRNQATIFLLCLYALYRRTVLDI